MRRSIHLAATVIASGLVWGCTTTTTKSDSSTASPTAMTKAQSPNYASATAEEADKEAVAHIYGAGDTHDKIHGMATFTAAATGVKVVVDVDGLTPGKHGIHIHEKADLSDAKLMNAGGHFNPEGAEHHHAGTDDPKRHAGDLGNITVDDKGHGHLEVSTDALSIDSGKNGVVGHSIIIHEKEDDLKTQQPPGNAGGRVAGGAIVVPVGQKS